jgi:hypothetical protein
MRSCSVRIAVLIAIDGGLTVAGIVYASIPDSNGVIHGCYANRNGGLRVIDTGAGESCKANRETPLSWNHAGPMGPPGPAGPSDAYAVEGSRVIPGDGTTYTVASMSLPEGTFVVSAVVRIVNNVNPGTFVTCLTLSDGQPILDGASETAVDQAHVAALPTLGVASIRNVTSSTLTLACRSNTSSVGIDTFVVATKIGTFHGP